MRVKCKLATYTVDTILPIGVNIVSMHIPCYIPLLSGVARMTELPGHCMGTHTCALPNACLEAAKSAHFPLKSYLAIGKGSSSIFIHFNVVFELNSGLFLPAAKAEGVHSSLIASHKIAIRDLFSALILPGHLYNPGTGPGRPGCSYATACSGTSMHA